MINYFTGWAEEWYHMHQRIFKDTFRIKIPLFFMHIMPIFNKPTLLAALLAKERVGYGEFETAGYNAFCAYLVPNRR